MATQIDLQDALGDLLSFQDGGCGQEPGAADPSERIEFSRPPRHGIQRFDIRSEEELREAALEHHASLERERALWEYADRLNEGAIGLLREAVEREADPSVRWTTLWALQKFGGVQGLDAIAEALRDEHPEVRDWARLLLSEKDGPRRYKTEGRELGFSKENPFDQTLPLMIAGYARVQVPGLGWIQATLSPQWFESIMGRVMACTRQETFTSDLVIEKRITGYHPDGTDHYEIFKFHGFSYPLAPGIHYHHYEARAAHTFYPSGKVEEVSQPPLPDVIVNIQRGAVTVTEMSLDAIRPRSVVQSVRGRYMGPAYIDLRRVADNGMEIGPGEVQLSSYHHPVAGPLTNTFLYGTFKGKLSDLNGDGVLDVNTEPCHGTLDGELDTDLDGIADYDPYDACVPQR